MDEKFTLIADAITEFVGRWFFSAISLIVLIVWTVYGISHIPNWFTSPDWNFPANSITTLGEWFLAAFTLAAANRVERRTHDLLETIQQQAEASVKATQRDVAVSHKNEEDLNEIKESLVRLELLLNLRKKRREERMANDEQQH